MIRSLPLALALFAATAAMAQPEDEAHRADRLRTEALNSRSANGYASGTPRPDDARAYARAHSDYQARLAAWRRQVAACQAGDYDACDPH